MSKGLEILPTKRLDADWPNLFSKKLSSQSNVIGVDKDNDHSFFVTWNQNRTLHIFFSIKEREIFPDATFLEGVKNPDRIDENQFLEKFAKIDYYLTLSSTGGRRLGELELMIYTASILGEMTEGIILFEQDILGYKGNLVYLSADIIL